MIDNVSSLKLKEIWIGECRTRLGKWSHSRGISRGSTMRRQPQRPTLGTLSKNESVVWLRKKECCIDKVWSHSLGSSRGSTTRCQPRRPTPGTLLKKLFCCSTSQAFKLGIGSSRWILQISWKLHVKNKGIMTEIWRIHHKRLLNLNYRPRPILLKLTNCTI